MIDQLSISLIGGKKIYFASDFHLGAPNNEVSSLREKKIITWLDSIKADAQAIFLVGDLFDFWYEYKKAIPKGFVRFQGKIAELTDSGIQIYFFIGNHDMWMFDYFEKELGVTIFRDELDLKINDTLIRIGHGDGLGPNDKFYKFIKVFFRSKICIKLFGFIHPNLGIGLADFWSKSSRKKGDKHPEVYLGEDEWILQHCKEQEVLRHHDLYIYGHRHLVIDQQFTETSRYVNLGHWFENGQYAYFDGKDLEIVSL